VYCPDGSFLLDYLDEDRPASTDAKAFLEAHPHREYQISTIAMFGVPRGGARLRGPTDVADLIEQLDWADQLPFTMAGAREAALIDDELASEGDEINLGDVLIAGSVREADGAVVTRDDRFQRVDGLDVESY
jgi:predicted nucleic acid-binding protein